MTQKQSSDAVETVKDDDTAFDVKIEGEPHPEITSESDAPPKEVKPEPKKEEDIEALKRQLASLRNAQEMAQARAYEAERRMQENAQAYSNMRGMAEQSQYDAIVTAMGAAQVEVDSAKRDIATAGSVQDYVALADAQERLSAAKARMMRLEEGKEVFESRSRYEEQQSQPQLQQDPIESNPALLPEEKKWLRAHPEALSDARMNAKLNAAYYEAVDKGLQRGTPEYIEFIETSMGYRNAPEKVAEPAEDPVMVAAPPSRSSPSGTGTGGAKTSYTLTKEEAAIAKAAGITPSEYVRQKIHLQELKKQGHYTSQG